MTTKSLNLVIFFLCLNFFSCAQNTENFNSIDEEIGDSSEKASIVSVSVSGVEDNYNFNVGIASPDTGCNQYANWWEVVTEDGSLIYRRILAHSHVNEQPFVRSGGAVIIKSNQVVIIRAHMNTSGYGTIVYKGSVSSGFTSSITAIDFASELASQVPLPNNCAF